MLKNRGSLTRRSVLTDRAGGKQVDDQISFHLNYSPDCQFCLCPAVSEARYGGKAIRFCGDPSCKEKAIKNLLIAIARSCFGAPYKYGAKPEEAPNFFDCSSFVQYVFGKSGIALPRSAILQAACGEEVKAHPRHGSEILVGDLLFFRGTKGHYDDSLFGGRKIEIGHVAIYAGDGKIIHAASAAQSVSEKSLSDVAEPIVMLRRIN